MHKNLKTFTIVFLLAFLLFGSIGSVLAYWSDRTNVSENAFNLGSVSCSVQETFDKTTKIKTNVSVKNTSQTVEFIRVAIVVNWISSNGFAAEPPKLGVDYEMTLNETDWFLGDDGYYYYRHVVQKEDNTSDLIYSAQVLNSANIPNGFTLSIEIVASAIQANPTNAVADAWACVEYDETTNELVKK